MTKSLLQKHSKYLQPIFSLTIPLFHFAVFCKVLNIFLYFFRLDVYSKNTTAVHQIFGGYLRSQVKCLMCEHKSNTYDPMLDLALDIKVRTVVISKLLKLYVLS